MKIFKLVTGCLALSISLQIHAATIVFDVLGIDNLEWLDLTTTSGKNRAEVELLLGAGEFLDGWRYANRSEVETLYDSLWGGVSDGYSADNFIGAHSFFNNFGTPTLFGPDGYDEYGASSWTTLFGNSLECSTNADESCMGVVAIYDMDYGASLNVGYFHDDYGLSTGEDATNNQLSTSSLYGYPYQASHLVREVAVVPIPAALWLFVSGMTAFFAMARRPWAMTTTRL